MEIKIIDKEVVWQKVFNDLGSASFLQSWEWGELQKTLGYQVFRLGLYKKNNLLSVAQTILVSAKRGNFLFIPHGPLTYPGAIRTINYFKKELIKIAQKENCAFIRISPIDIDTLANRQVYKSLGFKKAPLYMHAENVWVLPLDKSEEDLLNQMRKTTRYLIRKASRDGVIIEKRTDKKAVDDFYRIYEETAKREQFVPFSKDYIKNEFEAFNKTGNAIFIFSKLAGLNSSMGAEVLGIPIPLRKIEEDFVGQAALAGLSAGALAKAGKKPKQDPLNKNYLASALILFTKSSAFYHQGASIHTKYPAPYLMQWEAIREAKKQGCQLYNFWGIAPDENKDHPWLGLTMFKKGFGGNQIDYLPTYDLIISPKYYLTFCYEKLLRWKRRV